MFFFKNKKKAQDRVIFKKNANPARRRLSDKELKFSRILFYLLLCVFIAVSVYILLFSSYLKIQSIGVHGIKELDYGAVMARTESVIQGKYLKIIPADNYFLVSKRKVAKSLTDEFKKIKSIEIEKTFPVLISIEIKERDSLILWCSGGPCYIIDESGFAYASCDLNAPEVAQNNLIQIIDTSARPVEIEEKILNEEYVSYLLALRKAIGNIDIKVSEQWRTPSLVADEVEIETSQGWRVYFSSKINSDGALRTLKTFLEGEIGDKKEKLEYVDLRIENKVFYRLKNEDNSTAENQPEEK